MFQVSIPAWYDWERAKRNDFEIPECFNSSLVRLGASTQKCKNSTTQFQFQLGTIGRATMFKKNRLFRRFNSSLVRLGGWNRCSNDCWNRVSIPAWYDWELPSIFLDESNLVVSIPAWYDWENVKDKVNFMQLLFQFQLGTIGSY